MTTGMHTIRVLYCIDCHENVGWKYEIAYEEDQKYKEGRFILEEELCHSSHTHDAGEGWSSYGNEEEDDAEEEEEYQSSSGPSNS